MTAQLRVAVLLVFGLVLIRVGSGTVLLRYVRPSSRWLVIVAGAVIAIVAAGSLLSGGRGPASQLGWLALAPVAALVLVAPPALGAFTAGRQGLGSLPAAGSAFAALPGRGTARLTVVEFALRSMDAGGRTLRGRRVELLGFVAGPAPGGFTLARLTITCCAADAVAVEVAVRARGPVPAVNSWIEVTGAYAGRRTPEEPLLAATAVSPAAAPADPYVD